MGELSSGPDPELAVHMAKVVLHGRRTDEHLGGDVLVGSTLRARAPRLLDSCGVRSNRVSEMCTRRSPWPPESALAVVRTHPYRTRKTAHGRSATGRGRYAAVARAGAIPHTGVAVRAEVETNLVGRSHSIACWYRASA